MIDKTIEFNEAGALIQFFRDHAQRIKSEKINGIYLLDPEPYKRTIFGIDVFDVDEPVILVFDTIAVKITYYYWSEAIIRTMPMDEFANIQNRSEWLQGLLTIDEMIAEYQPFMEGGDLTFPCSPIKDLYLERFSDEFEIDFGTGETRPAGGDYFKTVILQGEDYGILLSGEDAEEDGRMYFGLMDKETTDRLIEEHSFEHITEDTKIEKKSDNKKWCFCVAGNIVKTRIDENGTLRYGTSGFSGGTKVYIQGRFWSDYYKNKGEISVIGLSRGKRYECLEVPVTAIENVRFQRVFNPKVVDMMEYFEFESAWWHRMAIDKKEAKAFAEAWNNGTLIRKPTQETDKKAVTLEPEAEKKSSICSFFMKLFSRK